MLKKKKQTFQVLTRATKNVTILPRKNVGPTSIEKGPRTYERAAILNHCANRRTGKHYLKQKQKGML